MILSFLRRKINLRGLLSFAIPVLIVGIAYICRGIAPFGQSNLLSMDAFSQYYPMLCEKFSGNSAFSFGGALGFNRLVQGAYYTNSPLWLLLRPFPHSAWPALIDLIILLRFGLAGWTFSLYLREKGMDNRFMPAFSAAYALSAYSLAFINQLMWADAVVLLPVVAMGIERLCGQGRKMLYIFSLFLVLYSNFYVGYMVCLFCVFYFFLCLLSGPLSFRRWVQKTGAFALSSILAGGLCAFVLLPVAIGLSKTIASGLGYTGPIKPYHSWWEVLGKLLPLGQISLAYEAPNLYCGLICVVFFLLFPFFCRKKAKTIPIFLLCVVFSLLSCNLNLLDFIWHGFHYPNQLPGRQTFIFVFGIVGCAAFVMCCIGKKSKWITGILSGILVLELGANAIYTIVSQTWTAGTAQILKEDALMEYVTSLTEERDKEESDFYRTELKTMYYHNFGQKYHVNGISYYSSTMSAEAYTFFERMGGQVYALNVSSSYNPTNIQNAIFGVRYLIALEDEDMDGLYLNEIGRKDSAVVYENEYALPLLLVVDEKITEIDMEKKVSTRVRENEIFRAMVGTLDEKRSITRPVFTYGVKKLKESAAEISRFSGRCIEASVRCDRDSILFTSIPDDGGWRIYIDGERVPVLRLLGYLCGAKLPAGEHDVRMVYVTPGIIMGTSISAICLLAVLLLWYKEKPVKMKRLVAVFHLSGCIRKK